jgi:hypothetical protein
VLLCTIPTSDILLHGTITWAMASTRRIVTPSSALVNFGVTRWPSAETKQAEQT